MKVVIIGAGSNSFGRGQIIDILNSRELHGRGLTLTLVDTRPDALDLMARFAVMVRDAAGWDATIEHTTDRCEALPGADYIVCAVARKRMELWEQDFRVPLSYGFRHCLGENGGPGAVFHALRSLELVIPICRDAERLCPDALFLNFTNPETRVLHAILHLTKVKAAGLCHGVFSVMPFIQKYTGRPAGEFRVTSAGINHFYCLRRVEDKATGEDILPGLIERAAADESAPPIFRRFAEIFGVFTFPSDDHIGEYLSFGSEFHGSRWPYGLESRGVPAGETGPHRSAVEDYVSGRNRPDGFLTGRSGELAAPIICDIELDRGERREAVNVLNSDGCIENLPGGAAVEVPAVVDAGGIHPEHVGALPEPFAAIIRTQLTIIELVTEAYRTRDRKLLLQALLLDPNVDSIENARSMLDLMFRLQKDFLPECP